MGIQTEAASGVCSVSWTLAPRAATGDSSGSLRLSATGEETATFQLTKVYEYTTLRETFGVFII